MANNHPKRPRDPNQLAKVVIDIATGNRDDTVPEKPNEFAKKGGLKGGIARANSLSAERRKQIARLAATARWKNDK